MAGTRAAMVARAPLLLLAFALASCAGGAPAATRTPSTPATIPTPNQPDPRASAVPDASVWPQQDTPFAQAPAQMQQAWAAYGVTLIPSRHVFDNMPAVPTVVNKTNGALTQAQAQQTGLAYYRTEALWGWAAANDQMKLQLYLANQGFLNTDAGAAEGKAEAVQEPRCALYPSQLAVVPVDASIKSFLEALGYTVSGANALVQNYSTPCSVTARTPSGEQVIHKWPLGLILDIETGTVRQDPVLGLAYFGEADRECPESGFPTPWPGETLPPGTVPSPGSPEGGPLACGVFGT